MDTRDKALETGAVQRKEGAFTSFANVARRTAFIVPDLKPTLIKVLKRHDFRNDFDPAIFVRYRHNEGVFIQTFGYNTLIALTKKRNQAFFSVLISEM